MIYISIKKMQCFLRTVYKRCRVAVAQAGSVCHTQPVLRGSSVKHKDVARTLGRRQTSEKLGKTEDTRQLSRAAIFLCLVCLTVSAARCALLPSARPQPDCIANARRVPWACTDYRSSRGCWWTGATLRRSQMMMRATNASSTTRVRLVQVRVRRQRCASPRSSVGAAARSGAEAEGWKAAVLKLEEKLKKASSALTAGRIPERSPES
jgi:hypothetical protein